MGISLNPDAAVEGGGGLVDDADLEVKDARVGNYTYPNSSTTTVAIILTLTDGDEDYEQAYSIGRTDEWAPSRDGHEVEGLKGQEGMRKNCNAFKLLSNLVMAGYPQDKLTADVTELIGLVAHWKRVAQDDRVGIAPKKDAEGRERVSTTLVPSKVLNMPGESKSSGGKTPANDDPELKNEIFSFLATAVTEAGGSMPRREIFSAVLPFCKQHGYDANAVTPFIRNADAIRALGLQIDGDDNVTL